MVIVAPSETPAAKVRALIDTNVLIYYLDQADKTKARKALEAIDRIDVLFTSTMCYIEVMVGYPDTDTEGIAKADRMFGQFLLLASSSLIDKLAVAIRRRSLGKARASVDLTFSISCHRRNDHTNDVCRPSLRPHIHIDKRYWPK